jgi:hypothetical protein
MHCHHATPARLLAAALLLASTVLASCESLPGNRETQGAVIGGAGGAVLGAVIAKDNRLIGALIGGALGAGAGYLIGAKTDWFSDDEDEARDQAQRSAERAQRNPATVEQARRAKTADINDDGFVTLDEVVALEKAGFTDDEIIDRLEATDHVFDLNEDQEQVLLDNGVSRTVVNRMQRINQAERERLINSRTSRNDVISREPD